MLSKSFDGSRGQYGHLSLSSRDDGQESGLREKSDDEKDKQEKK